MYRLKEESMKVCTKCNFVKKATTSLYGSSTSRLFGIEHPSLEYCLHILRTITYALLLNLIQSCYTLIKMFSKMLIN